MTLLGVDPQPDRIDGLHQGEDIGLMESPTEVARGGRVGDPHGAEGIEVDRVVAAPFEMFTLDDNVLTLLRIT